jgi:hypothetical protein
MVCHWLINSNSSALAHNIRMQTLRFFPREAKNIKHDRYFPQGLERSNPHENYIRTREQLAELTASRENANDFEKMQMRKCKNEKMQMILSIMLLLSSFPNVCGENT